MSWENDDYAMNIPQRVRAWEENVAAMAATSKNGLLPQLPKNVQSHVLTALSGKKVKHYSNTPQKMMRHEKFLRNIPAGARTMNRRREQRQVAELMANLNRRHAEQRAANNAARQAREAVEAEQRAQEEFAERLRIGTTMPTESQRKANKAFQANKARMTSRIRRGKSNWFTPLRKRTRKARKTRKQ